MLLRCLIICFFFVCTFWNWLIWWIVQLPSAGGNPICKTTTNISQKNDLIKQFTSADCVFYYYLRVLPSWPTNWTSVDDSSFLWANVTISPRFLILYIHLDGLVSLKSFVANVLLISYTLLHLRCSLMGIRRFTSHSVSIFQTPPNLSTSSVALFLWRNWQMHQIALLLHN